MLMMETDLVNSVWHLCSPWITGLGSEAPQWETQLQFFNEHLTTLCLDVSFSGSTAGCVFYFGHLTWSLIGPFSIKQGSLSSFMSLWKASGEVGVDSPGWNSNMYVQIAVLCLIAIPAKGSACIKMQQSSSTSWPRGVWDLQH